MKRGILRGGIGSNPIPSNKPVDNLPPQLLNIATAHLMHDAITALRCIHDYYSLDPKAWIAKYKGSDSTIKTLRRLTGSVLADASKLGLRGDPEDAIKLLRQLEGAA